MLGSRPQIMETIEETTDLVREQVDSKMRELCEVIAGQDDFKEMCSHIEGFMSDEKAKFEYQTLNELGGMLQQKQAMGAEISDEEAGKFESLRDSFTTNETAMSFLKTQERLQLMQDHILRYVQRMFEIGHVPTQEEMEEGMCCDYRSGFEKPVEGAEAECCGGGSCDS